jgi:hypothetical protein
MTTRNGKIARLPKTIREQLNRRLQDGEPGVRLVDWVNSLPEAQRMLAGEFNGQPINEQNLTAWRQGGYEDWVRHKEALDCARTLAEEAEELAGESAEVPLAEHLSAPVALALGRLLREAVEAGDDPGERRRALLAVAHELALLRRCDHEAARLRVERERWAAEQGDADARQRAAEKMMPLQAMLLATVFGDMYEKKMKETGRVPAELLAFLSTVTPEQARAAGASAEELQELLQFGVKLNQGESRPIKPDEPDG